MASTVPTHRRRFEMAVLMIQEFDGTTDQYDEIDAKLDHQSNPIEGLIIHTAMDLGGGKMRVVDVWESQEALDTFTNDRLMPVMTEVLGPMDPDSGSPPEVREIHNVIQQ
jgi:hypothetical protein